MLKQKIFNNWLSIFLLTVFIFLNMGSVCLAGIEDRPLDTDDGYVLEKGTYYISSGLLFNKINSKNKEYVIKNTIGAGITNNFEVSAFIPVAYIDPDARDKAEGLGDIIIRPEFSLLKEQGNTPAMSLALWLNLRNGEQSKGLGAEECNYTFTLQISKNIAPFTFHLNFGYIFVGEPSGQDLDNVISYNTALEYALTKELVLVGELFGKTNPDPLATDDPLDALLGVMYKLSPHITLDFGAWAGLTNASSDYKLTCGAAFKF